MPKSTMGSGKWNPASSGVVMEKLRKRSELSKTQVANELGVHVRYIDEIEQGAEPTQRVMAVLDQLYGMNVQDWQALYLPTDAELDRQREYAERQADLTKRVAALGPEDEPVRFRG